MIRLAHAIYKIFSGLLLDSVIINNEIAITNIPPALQTSLDSCYSDSVENQIMQMKKNLFNAAFREIGINKDIYHVPNYDQFLNCCRTNRLEWNVIECFIQVHQHTYISSNEQKIATTYGVKIIDQYLDSSEQIFFVKNVVFTGAPDSGKPYLMNYIALYANFRGLKVSITELYHNELYKLVAHIFTNILRFL